MKSFTNFNPVAIVIVILLIVVNICACGIYQSQQKINRINKLERVVLHTDNDEMRLRAIDELASYGVYSEDNYATK